MELGKHGLFVVLWRPSLRQLLSRRRESCVGGIIVETLDLQACIRHPALYLVIKRTWIECIVLITL